MADDTAPIGTGHEAEKVAADPDGIDTIKTDPSPATGAAQATLSATTDQNGTDTDPLATVLASAAGDEIEKFIPSIPPDAAAALKGWLRLNIMWVQTEMEHAKLGTPVEDRAKLNP